MNEKIKKAKETKIVVVDVGAYIIYDTSGSNNIACSRKQNEINIKIFKMFTWIDQCQSRHIYNLS